jgi:hypothetical protein
MNGRALDSRVSPDWRSRQAQRNDPEPQCQQPQRPGLVEVTMSDTLSVANASPRRAELRANGFVCPLSGAAGGLEIAEPANGEPAIQGLVQIPRLDEGA